VSLRPNISGFDLTKMTAFIGCGDRMIAVRAERHARTVYARAEALDAIARRLNEAILGDIKRGMDGSEDAALVNAMIALARFEQMHLDTDSNMWKSAHLDWVLEGLPSRPDGANETEWMDACALVEHALLQRPLLGSWQDSDWTTYGYLDRDEVRRLLDYRRRFPSLGEDKYGFAPAFFGWLVEIDAAGLDYWFYAS
jgi:hypothetical protein